jgi:arginine utilization protein RocB
MMRTDMVRTARELVSIPSVNGTEGEKKISDYLESRLRAFSYFQSHPDQIIIQKLKDDPLERRNIIAWVKGDGDRTILLHGHTDTVGVEDYGSLAPYAFQPDELKEHLQEVRLTAEVREDLLSGDYMFGRGACDMKSGDAVILHILEDVSRHPERLHGNLMVSFNPVEENSHTGMIEEVPLLLRLKEKYHFNYILAVNHDFICPLYRNDPMKTIYTGAVGKLLPCFYIQGKETHVGQCYEGLDASLLAAELVREIHLNTAYCDTWLNEMTCPPSVLKLKDLKPWYNVQTAREALVYFNFAVHHASVNAITDKLLAAARQAFARAEDLMRASVSSYRSFSGQRVIFTSCKPCAYTFGQLQETALENGMITETEMKKMIEAEKKKGTDLREIPAVLIRHLLEMLGITDPVIILYYGVPYCPHNTVRDEKITDDLHQIIQMTQEDTGDQFRFMHFYPSLSDSSFLSIDDRTESLKCLKKNFPGMDELYPLPLDEIRQLNIPSVNFGCYGKDAHKWTERVNLPYTFGTLPVLLKNTIAWFLEGGEQ